MENVDKDVSTWLNRFKAYDELRASKAPVMEKKKAVEEDDEQGKNPWEKLAKGDKKEDEKVGDSHKTAKGGTVTKTEKGLKHVKESAPEADADTLAWMKRFANLGNMKGYGR